MFRYGRPLGQHFLFGNFPKKWLIGRFGMEFCAVKLSVLALDLAPATPSPLSFLPRGITTISTCKSFIDLGSRIASPFMGLELSYQA